MRFFALNLKMEHDLYNMSVGKDITTKNLALLIYGITGHVKMIKWDASKSDVMSGKADGRKSNKRGGMELYYRAGRRDTINL